MYTYQKTKRYFAQIADNMEELGGLEIEALGGREIKPAFRGLYFSAEPAALYRINYQARLCTRVMAPLLTFDCHSTKYLYQTAMKIDWQELIPAGKTFAINANVSNSKITHSQYATLCLKDAVVDALQQKRGFRPDVDTDNPDVLFNLHVHKNKATINLDTSGGSLHRRGYREERVAAPMQESLAAAIIGFSGWDGSRILLDPMCGSGTLLCEAMMAYCRIPAGYLRRHFGFFALPDFDEAVWLAVKEEADSGIVSLPEGIIRGSDISADAVQATAKNLDHFSQGKAVWLNTSRFQDLEPVNDAVIVTNPPYGLRMGDSKAAALLIEEFGNFLKHKCAGSTAYIYLGDRELLKKVGLKPSFKKPLKNGGLDGVLAKYEMY